MRGNSVRLHQGRFRSDIRKNVFTERIVKYGKRLPRELVEEDSTSEGKTVTEIGKVPVADLILRQYVCWKYNTAEKKQSRRFLNCVEDNFLTQLVSEPTRGGASLDLLVTNREGLVGDVVVGGHLSNCDMTEFSIQGEVRRRVSKTTTVDFRKAGFDLLRMLVERVPREAVLRGKGVQEGWAFFKKEILKAQEQAVPVCCKTNRWGRQPAWLNRELLLGLREKRRVYHFWKKGQALPEEYRDLVKSYREKIRKAKAQLELNLATVVRDNKKCFYKYNNNKRAKENLPPLLDVGGNVATKDEEKAEVLNAFFASVFNRSVIPRVFSPLSWKTGTESRIKPS
ncbi:hypothetical protein QYF61_001404 [Mycteria americana]|uniref:Uncharacterized protein n=1 Tax=Mycteria americana TaxID=33587 RepID=A0AAN7S0R6_MYCAM|nr:hypothetical protein QYF61_001404 [Mycteria americana]